MNFNLLKKDFLLTKHKAIVYLVICLGLSVFMKLTVHQELIENILIAALGGFFSYFITIIEFEAEGKYKAEATIVTLPYTRREIVMAKYYFVFTGSMVYYIVCIVAMGILTELGRSTFSAYGILYGVAFSVLVHSCMIPFFMKFDYIKAANIMMLGIMVWSAGFVIFTRKAVNIITVTQDVLSVKPYIFLVVSVIILVISCMVSLRIYEKKELM